MGHSYYPIALDLDGKRCLVVGGGTIAADKVEGLLAAGAVVTVVSPSLDPRLVRLAAARQIVHHRRPYRSTDLDGVYLTYAATDDLATNARIAAEARAAGSLVNAVDDPPNCDFFAVAVIRRGDLQIAVSTNGRSPAFARWMREYLETWLPAEHAELLPLLAEIREDLKRYGAIPPYEAWKAAIDDEVLKRVGRGDLLGARERLLARLTVYEPAAAGSSRLAVRVEA